MKRIISISIFLLSISLAFTQEYNKKNSYGQKTGVWVDYFPGDHIKRLRHYTPLRFRPDTFLFSRANSESFDTIISPNTDYVKTKHGYKAAGIFEGDLSRNDWTMYFEYDPSWQLIKVRKVDSNEPTTYLYGSQQEIVMVKHKFELEGIVGKSHQIAIPLKNLSDGRVSLKFTQAPNNIIASNPYRVPPNTEYNVKLNIIPEPGYKTYGLNLVGESFRIKLIVNTEAYHFKTSDFKESAPIIITDTSLLNV